MTICPELMKELTISDQLICEKAEIYGSWPSANSFQGVNLSFLSEGARILFYLTSTNSPRGRIYTTSVAVQTMDTTFNLLSYVPMQMRWFVYHGSGEDVQSFKNEIGYRLGRIGAVEYIEVVHRCIGAIVVNVDKLGFD